MKKRVLQSRAKSFSIMASVYKLQSNTLNKPKAAKRRVLMLSTRGIAFRHRHLMNDLEALLPHSKKESKLGSKSNLVEEVNELAELNSCDHIMLFEARKTDLYLWMCVAPNGPSVKFLVQNIHTTDELKMTGNCLKGSRAIMSFDKSFDTLPHHQLIKQILARCFSVPENTRRGKPFVDHVFQLSLGDGRVWFRNYQIVEKDDNNNMSLVEIGPRFVMQPIVLVQGSMGGPVLWNNPDFVSPNQMRSIAKNQKATTYANKKNQQAERVARLDEIGHELEDTVMDSVFE
jgi:ribosome biogenesis protein BRX1